MHYYAAAVRANPPWHFWTFAILQDIVLQTHKYSAETSIKRQLLMLTDATPLVTCWHYACIVVGWRPFEPLKRLFDISVWRAENLSVECPDAQTGVKLKLFEKTCARHNGVKNYVTVRILSSKHFRRFLSFCRDENYVKRCSNLSKLQVTWNSCFPE